LKNLTVDRRRLCRDPHPTHAHLAKTLRIDRVSPNKAVLTNMHIDLIMRRWRLKQR
jgi:hypothetical protein